MQRFHLLTVPEIVGNSVVAVIILCNIPREYHKQARTQTMHLLYIEFGGLICLRQRANPKLQSRKLIIGQRGQLKLQVTPKCTMWKYLWEQRPGGTGHF